MKRAVFAILFALVANFLATDADASQTDEEQGWHQWIEETKRKPGEYKKLQDMFTLETKILLARLGYDVGPLSPVLDTRTISVIRRYEANRKIRVTGDPLSFATMQQIAKDSSSIVRTPVRLPPMEVSDVLWERGHVTASGTWVIVGEEQGTGDQTAVIRCDRESRSCVETTVSLSGGTTLHVFTDLYEIARWDSDEIVMTSDFVCVKYVKRVLRKTKTADGVRTTSSREGACKDADQRVLPLKLVSGSDLSERRWEEYWKTYKALMQLPEESWRALSMK